MRSLARCQRRATWTQKGRHIDGAGRPGYSGAVTAHCGFSIEHEPARAIWSCAAQSAIWRQLGADVVPLPAGARDCLHPRRRSEQSRGTGRSPPQRDGGREPHRKTPIPVRPAYDTATGPGAEKGEAA
ncbi:MAG: hypothetical protein LBE67_11875 [Kocuria palustris]|nr:hypothetical protein [Kocuria palustris]